MLNEKQIRNAMRYESTKSLAFCNIAIKKNESGNPFIPSEVSDAIIYGKGKTRTLAVRTTYGRKLSFQTLGKVPANGEGYALAAEMIEQWLDN